MADRISPITLAVAKAYSRAVGSTITDISPTSTGLHFTTTSGSFDIDIDNWIVYTPEEKAKLEGIETGAEVNQDAFSNFVVGETTISSTEQEDSINFVAGNGITISPNADTKTITITNSEAGSLDYEALSNKPSINNITLLGNKTLSDIGISLVGTTNDYEDLTNKPTIPTKTSDLTNDSGFILNTVDNLVNYYVKTETYTATEINALINAITTLTIEIVTVLPTEDISTTTIYLIKEPDVNVYVQWMYINNEWTNLGNTEVDLSNYYTKAQADDKFVEKVTGKGLSTNDLTDSLKSDYDSAVTDKHTHTNKTILDDITASYTTEEKTKLLGIEENANNYELPTASASTLGGVKVDGTTITINDGIISSSGGVDIDDTTTSTTSVWSSNKVNEELENKVSTEIGRGLSTNDYTTEEKNKLSGIADNANNYSLPTATTSVLGGVKVDGSTIIIEDGIISSIGGGTVSSVNEVEPDIDGNITIDLDDVADGTTRKLEKIWIGTKAELDALGIYDVDTTYYTTDETDDNIINDNTITATSTWSSSKINTENENNVKTIGTQTINGQKTFVSSVYANGATGIADPQVRNIIASTEDLTAGTSELTTGSIYFVYE